MKKKYHKHFKIQNQLYRRFTNRGRGFTPRGFAMKKIFIARNRIYDISNKDINFNTYSFKNSDKLIELSSSLPAEDIALVNKSGDKFRYLFLFRNHSSMKSGVPVKEEFSSIRYPGLYFCNKRWVCVYSNSSNDGLYLITPPEFKYSQNHSTDITESSYAIYIPFDSIKTPILQAYLPMIQKAQFVLSKPDYTNRIVDDESVSFPLDVTSPDECYWMGKCITSGKIYVRSDNAPNEFRYGYKVKDYIQVEYLLKVAEEYLLQSNYSTIRGLYLYPIYYHDHTTNYNGTNLQWKSVGSPFGEPLSRLQKVYPSTYTNSDAYLYLVGQDPIYGGFIMVYLGKCDYGEYLGRNSYGDFSKEAREAIRSLAIPVGEFFDSSSIVNFSS